ncbi:hypothetical protein BcepSauron_108 [Burkholderia phage BcepSauron]|uniref:Uncharacterized protein n=1 Tax=Burkholderia phage BcepSauron TaxID=2530033 RepID=A0A482MLI4_9CAUD|nr:hypothetical protein H1O17_gp108 [Burkholderia phage BcepSauron]QBQ74488.1 hypothetical protein BcepSauron_108 [Burkholderia phage BcepSauron]
MQYKTNRQNHDFQIAYFMVGACHTADAAYALLHDLRQDREAALAMSKAGAKRTLAKQLKAHAQINNAEHEWERLEARADLEEITAMSEINDANVAACEAEIAFIHECIKRITPLRKYAHLPDAEAFQAAQADEWKFTLMRRAENYIMTQGMIPHDHFETMRLHPAFKTEIMPHMERVHQLASTPGARETLIATITNEKSAVRDALPRLEFKQLEEKQ